MEKLLLLPHIIHAFSLRKYFKGLDNLFWIWLGTWFIVLQYRPSIRLMKILESKEIGNIVLSISIESEGTRLYFMCSLHPTVCCDVRTSQQCWGQGGWIPCVLVSIYTRSTAKTSRASKESLICPVFRIVKPFEAAISVFCMFGCSFLIYLIY